MTVAGVRANHVQYVCFCMDQMNMIDLLPMLLPFRKDLKFETMASYLKMLVFQFLSCSPKHQ